MKRIIPCFVLVACIFNMLLCVPTTHAQGSTYEWITLPIISDKLANEAGVAHIPMFRKETETDSLYVELDSACSIIGASWYIENDGFGVNRDCTYLWCDSNLNMKLVISTDFVNRWKNPEEMLLEGNLFKCEKIEDIWYVDFIPFCDMFGASFYEVSEQSLGILEENIKNSFGVNNGDYLIDIESYLDFENYPYYIFVHSGVTLSSIYQKVKEYEDSYIWSYACYENIGLGNENLFQEIVYSEQMVSLSFNAANWLSNWINDEYGISKILNSLAVSNYNSSEHYKQALVNVVGVNYGRYLSSIDTSYEDFNQKTEELNSLLNHGTITSSALSSSSELLEKYFNASLPKELNGLDTAAKLVNLFGSSYQAYLETCDFHNKLNNVSENKIQLLTKSIIDNQSINNLSEIQRKVTDVLKTVNCTAGTTILLNSIDSYTGLVDSSKEICTLYQNQQQQLNEEIENALKTGEYVVGDEVIQWAFNDFRVIADSICKFVCTELVLPAVY